MSFQTILVDIQYVNTDVAVPLLQVDTVLERDGYIEDISYADSATTFSWKEPRGVSLPIDNTLALTGEPNFGSYYLRRSVLDYIAGIYLNRKAVQHICTGGALGPHHGAF